jgi:hypothetical protein
MSYIYKLLLISSILILLSGCIGSNQDIIYSNNATLDSISVPYIDSATIQNLNQAYDKIWSTGVISGGNFSHNATGGVQITSGIAILRTSNNHTAPLISVNFSAKNFTFAVDESGFIALGYNNGSPTLFKTPLLSDIDGDSQVTLFRIHRESDEIQYISAEGQNVDENLKLRRMLYDIHKFSHAEGGSILGNPSGLNVSVTSGRFYYGLNSIENLAHNTSNGVDTFEYYYRNGSGGWNDTINHTLNTDLYDTGTGKLTPLGSNKYKTSWVFLELSTDGICHVAIVYGQHQYTSLTAAQSDAIPTALPSALSQMGVLIGRYIIQEGSTSPALTQTVFAPTIQFVTV